MTQEQFIAMRCEQHNVNYLEYKKSFNKRRDRFVNNPNRRWSFYWHRLKKAYTLDEDDSDYRMARFYLIPSIRIGYAKTASWGSIVYGVEAYQHDIDVQIEFTRFEWGFTFSTWTE